MPIPKSVTKIKTKQGKSEVIFTSAVDGANYTIEELTKAALRDTGKVIIRFVKDATPERTGLLKKSWEKWVKKSKANGEVSLQLGVYTAAQARKKGQSYAHHAHLILLGHKTRNGGFVAGNNFFYQVVADNINLIRETQGKYLSAIENEQEARSIVESEEKLAEDE